MKLTKQSISQKLGKQRHGKYSVSGFNASAVVVISFRGDPSINLCVNGAHLREHADALSLLDVRIEKTDLSLVTPFRRNLKKKLEINVKSVLHRYLSLLNITS